MATLAIATAAAIAPWSIRNAAELHRFIPVADQTGITLAGTYNPASADNQRIPFAWRFYSAIPQDRVLIGRARTMTEPQLDSKLRDQALDYITDHPLAPFEAAFHNTLRLLEVEGSYARNASAASIGLPRGRANLGALAFWLLFLAALAGAFTRRARHGAGVS